MREDVSGRGFSSVPDGKALRKHPFLQCVIQLLVAFGCEAWERKIDRSS